MMIRTNLFSSLYTATRKNFFQANNIYIPYWTQVTAADVTIDLILDERARELIYEESRWNTLLRMGGTVAVDRIKKYAYWDYPRTTLNKTFNLWPIPQTVIDTNKDVKLEQNTGW